MEKKQNPVLSSDETSDKKHLVRTIIDDMNANGILKDFVDNESGIAPIEIQFADKTFVCNVENVSEKGASEKI